MSPLLFKVVEKGQYAYVLWPWSEPAAFLYDMLEHGARYRLEKAPIPDRRAWIQFRPVEGCHGESRQGLVYGFLDWGGYVYRRFQAVGAHYLTQHGLDGLPTQLWERAYEYGPGQPIGGKPLITFRVEPKAGGVFSLSFYDWMRYFVSGRNGPIQSLGITITKRKE